MVEDVDRELTPILAGEGLHRGVEMATRDPLQPAEPVERLPAQDVRAFLRLGEPQPTEDELQVRRLDAGRGLVRCGRPPRSLDGDRA